MDQTQAGTGASTIPPHDTTTLEMVVLMTPDMANFSGKVHGGALLNLLDRVAFSCASRFSQRYAVTLSVDQVVFRQPIHVGELVTFRAAINYAGRTSMEVGIRVEAENIRSGARRHTNSCYFTMVAVDEEGRRRKCRPMCRKPKLPNAACALPKPAANCAANSNNASTRPRRKGRRDESPLTPPTVTPGPDRRIQGHGRKAHHSVIPAPEPGSSRHASACRKPLPPSGLG